MPTNDVSVLNKTYGSPGRLIFREGPTGQPVLSLADSRGTCEIALYGAHVLSYQPAGQSPVLWLSKSAERIAVGQAIRGGIPVCWPWFGAHPGDARLPAHGFARTRRWRLLGTAYDSRQTGARLQLTHDAETLALWPHAFRLEMSITVGDALTVELTTTNKGDAPFTVSQALHTYLLVQEIGAVRVLGLENTAYHDVSPAARDGRQHGAILVGEETDRVYQKTAGEVTLVDPGYGRRIVIGKRGSHTTVVWNPWIEKAGRLSDMAPDDYRRFICIETANAESDTVTLEPGAEHVISATIQSLPT
jgi:glucose-6-phosphate 1-epimerase